MLSILRTAILLLALLAPLGAPAAGLLRLSAPEGAAFDALRRNYGFPAEAVHGAVVDRAAALGLRPGQRVTLDLPRALRYQVVFERSEELPSGAQVWVGYLEGQEKTQRVILTLSGDAAYGRILTPEGEFILETNAEGQWLYDMKTARQNLVLARYEAPDTHLAPPQVLAPKDLAEKREKAGAPSTIDVLIVYTPNMVTRLGSVANVRARMDHLIALTNQSYIDSGIAASLRFVRMEAVSYSDTTDNNTALYEISGTNGSSAVTIPATLTPVAGWRNTYGADLVLMLRGYVNASHGSCGVAWLSVSRWSGSIYSSPDFGYGVVSDGWDGMYGCGEYTFAHEVGHLFGATHDRVTEGQPTGADPNLVYSYAYGYGVASSFNTIMAYGSSFGWPTQYAVFSSPLLTCAGQPCGKDVGQPDEAYNALALENTRGLLAAYRAAVPQAAQAFVSAKTGNDANAASNCPVTAPCRGFGAAAAVVQTGGEIVALHSGGYGPVTLQRSMTLAAAPGVAVSISVATGAGVSIVEPSIQVTLRGLAITSQGGSHGVEITANAQVQIEDCAISGFASGAGIRATTASQVRVLNSTVSNNSQGLQLQNGATASVMRSAFSGNAQGIVATSSVSGRNTAASVSRSVVTQNTTGISAQASASGATTAVSVFHSVVTRNSSRGLEQIASGGGSSTMESAGRNTVRQNGTDVYGTLTTVPPI